MRNIFILIILINSFLSSCTDVVDVDLADAGERVVVEASILWNKDTDGKNQTIRLSKSSGFFQQNKNKPLTGASVTIIKQKEGTQFSFTDNNDGTYTTNEFIPEINESYELNILYNGQHYQGTETLISVANIEETEVSTRDEGDGIENILLLYYQDPANEANFYLGVVNNNELIPQNDNFNNGNRTFLEVSLGEELIPRDKTEISFQGVSENFYNYINLLTLQSEESDGPFSTVPVQLKGNCKNINNPYEEVLGYFRLSEAVQIENEVN